MTRRPAAAVTRLGAQWLVGGLALVMAPHLLRLPPLLITLCLAALGWRVGADRRGWRLPGTVVRLGLTFAAIAAVAASYHTIIGYEAGTALLAVMLSLKLMEMTTLRDAMVVVLLAYFLVAAGFLFDQSLLAGVYLFGAVAVLTAALVVLNHPAARSELGRDYLQRSVTLLLQALPLMAVLFVLFPRIPSLGWTLAPGPAAGRTGLSDSLTMGDVSALVDSTEVAFRVEFAGSPPPPKWYWRGPVLWHTDGKRWTALTATEQRQLGPPPPFRPLGEGHEYTVWRPDARERWLPALELPARAPGGSVFGSDFQILVGRSTIHRYQLQSHPRYRWLDPRGDSRALALALPPGGNPRTQALATEWKRSLTPRARVGAALQLFRDGPYFYTRNPPLLGADPVDEFLFASRRGFCEHYAAAFVTLMRGAGVPARIVTGYEGGEYNSVGGYWVVRQSDAHAWAEVYLDDEGWTRVDPTAVIPPARVEASARTTRDADGGGNRALLAWPLRGWYLAREGLDTINYQWNRWVAGYSAERQRELFARLGLRGWNNAAIAALIVISCATALAVAVWWMQRRRRERDPVVRSYLRFCRKLARAGMARGSREGEQAYARRVASARPELAAQAQRITDLFLRQRYGHTAAHELRELRQRVAQFKP